MEINLPYFSGICLRRLGKNKEKSQESWSFDEYLNPGSPEYEASLLHTDRLYSVSSRWSVDSIHLSFWA
jgi:hypothetical protein